MASPEEKPWRVEYSERAEVDRDGIYLWLNQRSPDFAHAWLEKLRTRVDGLTVTPRGYPRADEDDEQNVPGQEVRTMLYFGPGGRKGRNVPAWRILYLLIEPTDDEDEGIIRILRIRHSSQNPTGDADAGG